MSVTPSTSIIPVENMSRIDDVSLATSAFISVKFDFEHFPPGRLSMCYGGCDFKECCCMVSPNISSVRFTSNGLFVKTKSKQFFSRVFTCTIWSRP